MRPRPEPQTLRETIRTELQFPAAPGFFSFLQTGQQDGQHGFLHMEAVLRLVKDLVGVFFKDSGGDLLSRCAGRQWRSMASGFAPPSAAGHLKAREVPQAALTLGGAGGRIPCGGHHHIGILHASAGSVSR